MSSLSRRAGSVLVHNGSLREPGLRVNAATSCRSATVSAISCARSKGFLVQSPVKSRQPVSSHAALRSRSIGPSSPPKAVRRSARRMPSGGSASCSCSHRPNASSNSRAAAGSVSTSKSGSMRASTGRSRSSSAQKPWMVLMCASSSRVSAASSRRRASLSATRCSTAVRSRSRRSRSRSFNSPAAFSVKVTATILSTVVRPSARIRTIRPTSSVVLPVPAAASTTSVSSRAVAISARAAASDKAAVSTITASPGATSDR